LERERLAQVLHDTLAQDLWYTALLVEQARAAVAQGAVERTTERLDAMRSFIAGQYLTARSLIAALRSEQEALDPVIEVRQFLRRVDEVAPGLLRVAADWEALAAVVEAQAVTGIIRELVTNALKHSGATAIDLSIGAEGDRLRIAVVDNGVGLPDLDAGREEPLRAMHARAAALGGTCEVASQPGGGVAVTVWLPRGRR
jgi:signal transduction histidine kinase